MAGHHLVAPPEKTGAAPVFGCSALLPPPPVDLYALAPGGVVRRGELCLVRAAQHHARASRCVPSLPFPPMQPAMSGANHTPAVFVGVGTPACEPRGVASPRFANRLSATFCQPALRALWVPTQDSKTVAIRVCGRAHLTGTALTARARHVKDWDTGFLPRLGAPLPRRAASISGDSPPADPRLPLAARGSESFFSAIAPVFRAKPPCPSCKELSVSDAREMSRLQQT